MNKQKLAISHRALAIKRAFTLIELLVVISIIGILAGSGFAAYREFSRRQQLFEAVNQVKSDLLLAQQRALSGEKPPSCSRNLNGWSVYFPGGSDTTTYYYFVADCGNPGIEIWDPFMKTVTLPPGIVVNTVRIGGQAIIFKVLAQGTTSASDQIITLTQRATGRTATITVTRAGGIF